VPEEAAAAGEMYAGLLLAAGTDIAVVRFKHPSKPGRVTISGTSVTTWRPGRSEVS
jgi:hypothetical protein